MDSSAYSNLPSTDQNLKKSRGLSIVKIATQKPNQRATDLLENCKRWGVKVYHVEKILSKVKKLKNMISTELVKDLLKKKEHKVQEQPPDARKLLPPFIKIEDIKRIYKPIFREFPSWTEVIDPTLSYNISQLHKQFKKTGNLIQATRPVFGEISVNVQTVPDVTKTSRTKSYTKLTDTGLPASNSTISTVSTTVHAKGKTKENNLHIFKMKNGHIRAKTFYCEICHKNYLNLDEHIKTQKHKNFMSDPLNFLPIQNVLASLPKREDLLLSKLVADYESFDMSYGIRDYLEYPLIQKYDSSIQNFAKSKIEKIHDTCSDIFINGISNSDNSLATEPYSFLDPEVISPSCSSPDSVALPFLQDSIEKCEQPSQHYVGVSRDLAASRKRSLDLENLELAENVNLTEILQDATSMVAENNCSSTAVETLEKVTLLASDFTVRNSDSAINVIDVNAKENEMDENWKPLVRSAIKRKVPCMNSELNRYQICSKAFENSPVKRKKSKKTKLFYNKNQNSTCSSNSCDEITPTLFFKSCMFNNNISNVNTESVPLKNSCENHPSNLQDSMSEQSMNPNCFENYSDHISALKRKTENKTEPKQDAYRTCSQTVFTHEMEDTNLFSNREKKKESSVLKFKKGLLFCNRSNNAVIDDLHTQNNLLSEELENSDNKQSLYIDPALPNKTEAYKEPVAETLNICDERRKFKQMFLSKKEIFDRHFSSQLHSDTSNDSGICMQVIPFKSSKLHSSFEQCIEKEPCLSNSAKYFDVRKQDYPIDIITIPSFNILADASNVHDPESEENFEFQDAAHSDKNEIQVSSTSFVPNICISDFKDSLSCSISAASKIEPNFDCSSCTTFKNFVVDEKNIQHDSFMEKTEPIAFQISVNNSDNQLKNVNFASKKYALLNKQVTVHKLNTSNVVYCPKMWYIAEFNISEKYAPCNITNDFIDESKYISLSISNLQVLHICDVDFQTCLLLYNLKHCFVGNEISIKGSSKFQDYSISVDFEPNISPVKKQNMISHFSLQKLSHVYGKRDKWNLLLLKVQNGKISEIIDMIMSKCGELVYTDICNALKSNQHKHDSSYMAMMFPVVNKKNYRDSNCSEKCCQNNCYHIPDNYPTIFFLNDQINNELMNYPFVNDEPLNLCLKERGENKEISSFQPALPFSCGSLCLHPYKCESLNISFFDMMHSELIPPILKDPSDSEFCSSIGLNSSICKEHIHNCTDPYFDEIMQVHQLLYHEHQGVDLISLCCSEYESSKRTAHSFETSCIKCSHHKTDNLECIKYNSVDTSGCMHENPLSLVSKRNYPEQSNISVDEAARGQDNYNENTEHSSEYVVIEEADYDSSSEDEWEPLRSEVDSLCHSLCNEDSD
ncbi:DBF4-type domain-containing protein [Nephila pilipes]|uniref:DBF4-type domain-containing protein n=1 Tax=Nephila pilipes TaxID=299642 RepID=A0A8X6U6V5_NEPPI|nr:DBF4-type domain-containing protein [Nephila pilipes]